MVILFLVFVMSDSSAISGGKPCTECVKERPRRLVKTSHTPIAWSYSKTSGSFRRPIAFDGFAAAARQIVGKPDSCAFGRG
jgi:hypothetical protein